MVTSFYIIKSG